MSIWSELRDGIHEQGFSYHDIDNNFKLLGGTMWPALKLNKIYLKNKCIPHSSVCICGKENIVQNFYVGLNRNKFVIVGSKCYKQFPCKIDFRREYRNVRN